MAGEPERGGRPVGPVRHIVSLLIEGATPGALFGLATGLNYRRHFGVIGLGPIVVAHSGSWAIGRVVADAFADQASSPVKAKVLTGLFGGAIVIAAAFAAGLGFASVPVEAVGTSAWVLLDLLMARIRAARRSRRMRRGDDEDGGGS